MKPSHTEWQRLVTAARQAPLAPDATAPYGFSTRVAAQSQLSGRVGSTTNPFTRFSWPALGLATLIMAVTVAANIQPLMSSLADEAAAWSETVPEAGDSST